jgi:hypothetical protein
MPEIYKLSGDDKPPQPIAADHEASFIVPDEEQQQAWEHYMQGGKRNRPPSYRGPERRSRASLIDRQISVVSGMTVTSKKNTERDQLINEFQEWAPTSLAEGRSVLLGQQRKANIAANTQNGKGESALRDTVHRYQGYLIEAAHDLDVLQSTFRYDEEAGDLPDPSKFRNSPEAQEVIIKQLMTRGFLWDRYENHWPARTTHKHEERNKYWKGFVTEAVKTASNESIAELVNTFYERAKNRFRYWNKVYRPVEKMPAVRVLIEKGEIMPITAVRLLDQKYQREWTEEHPEEPAESHDTQFDPMLPPQARTEIAEAGIKDRLRVQSKNEEYDAAWDREERRFRHVPNTIFQRLGRQGLKPALTAQEQFEADDAAELADISERARQPKQPSKAKRSFKRRGPGESGPSDKRKEPDYR